MKKFKFRLEKVLQFREATKEEKLRELQQVTIKLQESQQKLEDLEHEFVKGEIPENEVLLVSEVYIRSSYCERLKREKKSLIEEVATRQQEVEAAREVYLEALREFEALVKLKDRRHQEYLFEVAKEEEKFLDELVTQRVVMSGKE